MERVIKQHGVWWSVIKAVPAVKAAVALEEDEGRWRTLHFVCGGLFPQADCIGKDKRHSTYIKQNSCDAIAVLKSKKKKHSQVSQQDFSCLCNSDHNFLCSVVCDALCGIGLLTVTVLASHYKGEP